ncbi:hypothetical protein Q2T46_10755 [Thermoanaerobacterium sp. CMT5567-10]|uniref:hypothetical protein n=1 Tax=Thermoanaerobacterium sp. CMT5567-10 TaxID=3061989 RepID=UPI00287FDE11|nr:hypothetical protein [Thermoanaerobacterium sp. CMT5567-10]WKV08022.2 hypothetical protein Q2T46_10755 [Thermoanaerobacterium sp. CMT5567-10]
MLEISKLYIGSDGALNWIETCNKELNDKHNKTAKKIDESFKAKNMIKLYDAIDDFKSTIIEIVHTYAKAKEFAKIHNINIEKVVWDETIHSFKISGNDIIEHEQVK